MTFFALVTYESGFESLVREGCDHVARLTSADFKTGEVLYNEVGEVAGAAADEMLKRMWIRFGVEVARKRSIAELEQVRAPRHVFSCCSLVTFLTSAYVGEESV